VRETTILKKFVYDVHLCQCLKIIQHFKFNLRQNQQYTALNTVLTLSKALKQRMFILEHVGGHLNDNDKDITRGR